MKDEKILEEITKMREEQKKKEEEQKEREKKMLDKIEKLELEKSIEFLRKKGIAKASKKMDRTASDGLVLANEREGEISIIEINSEYLNTKEIVKKTLKTDQDIDSIELVSRDWLST